MSRYTASNGKRVASATHAIYTWTCICGRTVRGNGGKASHQRGCRTYIEQRLAQLDALINGGVPAGMSPGKLDAERAKLREWLARIASKSAAMTAAEEITGLRRAAVGVLNAYSEFLDTDNLDVLRDSLTVLQEALHG